MARSCTEINGSPRFQVRSPHYIGGCSTQTLGSTEHTAIYNCPNTTTDHGRSHSILLVAKAIKKRDFLKYRAHSIRPKSRGTLSIAVIIIIIIITVLLFSPSVRGQWIESTVVPRLLLVLDYLDTLSTERHALSLICANSGKDNLCLFQKSLSNQSKPSALSLVPSACVRTKRIRATPTTRGAQQP